MLRLYGAKNRRIPRIEHGKRPHTRYIVIHDTESNNLDGVENYFRTTSPDAVGAHLGNGPHGELRQWASLDALVYHVQGGNTESIGIENCAYASFPRWRWIRRRQQRVTLAKAIARLCHLYALGLPSHPKNVKTHGDVSREKGIVGGHTDPGPNFPMHAVMKLARAYYRQWYRD